MRPSIKCPCALLLCCFRNSRVAASASSNCDLPTSSLALARSASAGSSFIAGSCNKHTSSPALATHRVLRSIAIEMIQIRITRFGKNLLLGRRYDSFSFFHSIDVVDGRCRDLLFQATRPMNLYLVNFVGLPQAEMHTLIGAGSVAAAGKNIGPLSNGARCHKHFGTNRVSRTLWSADQSKCGPVVVTLHDISHQRRARVHDVNDDVHVPIVEEITDGRTATG